MTLCGTHRREGFLFFSLSLIYYFLPCQTMLIRSIWPLVLVVPLGNFFILFGPNNCVDYLCCLSHLPLEKLYRLSRVFCLPGNSRRQYLLNVYLSFGATVFVSIFICTLANVCVSVFDLCGELIKVIFFVLQL